MRTLLLAAALAAIGLTPAQRTIFARSDAPLC